MGTVKNEALERFFKKLEEADKKVTYDDVRLRTEYSEVLPTEVDISSNFSRNVSLRVPIISSAMDTVTEIDMAIRMAELGGLGVIHKNMLPEEQARQVNRVKLHLNGLVEKPITVDPDATIGEVLALREEKPYSFHTFPVLRDGVMVGIITRNNFEFARNDKQTVGEVMTRDVKTLPPSTSMQDALELMRKEHKKVIPLIDDQGHIAGLYVLSDINRVLRDTSTCNVDTNGHLCVGAAIGVGSDALLRAATLTARNAPDVFVLDTAHGYSKNVIDTIKQLKKKYPEIDIVAGNVSTGAGAKALADAGADGILVGQGGGAICTTRIIAGIGCPQVSAVYECAMAVDIPVCADGGIRNSGDIAIALSVGARSVMLGRVLAGTDEAPGDVRDFGEMRVKTYRGMGSLGAMIDNRTSRARYGQTDVNIEDLIPEGVEAFVTYTGPLKREFVQYAGGLRSAMGYTGSKNLEVFHTRVQLFRISGSGLSESHPHDLVSVKSAPNYQGRWT